MISDSALSDDLEAGGLLKLIRWSVLSCLLTGKSPPLTAYAFYYKAGLSASCRRSGEECRTHIYDDVTGAGDGKTELGTGSLDDLDCPAHGRGLRFWSIKRARAGRI